MKRKIYSMIITLLATLSLMTTAYAADYGVIYDATERLGTDAVQELGTKILPTFSDTYGIDLRVDVLTTLADFETIEDAAAFLYEEYEYGRGGGKNGVTLTLLAEKDKTGVALKDWCIYQDGASEELIASNAWKMPREFYALMKASAWEGSAETDAEVFAQAITVIKDTLEQFVLDGGVENSIWSRETGLISANRLAQRTNGEEIVSNVPYLLDYSNILTGEEETLLMEEADKQAQQHQFGFYIVTIEDYQQYTDGSVQDAAEYIYTQYGMGVGEDKDGLLLLLSTKDRDYSLLTHGTYGNYAFSQYAREKLQEFFLDDFGADNMFVGFMDYLVVGGEFLTAAEDGKPYSSKNPFITEEERQENIAFGLGIILGVPLVVAGIVIFILSGKMKSVAVAAKASDYMSGEVELTEKADHFSHVTTVRTKKEQQRSSSNSSSGGFSGTSGKY